MIYRKEIDGLRALAIIPVVFSHLGTNILSGGFIGVDIFFVISGYLITSIIYEDFESGKFTLINFYERRIRRIIPALYLMLIIFFLWVFIFWSPYDLRNVSQSVVATTFFANNILLFLENNDYFAVFNNSNQINPLLHTWSLGVEEQFYIVYPIILFVFLKLKPKIIIYILSFLLIFSLLINVNQSNAIQNFYLPYARAWELLFGSLAFYFFNYLKKKNIDKFFISFGDIGFILIILSLFLFSNHFKLSSIFLILPTLGTFLIIISTNKNCLSYKFLSNKIVVFFGLISYSLYIWHLPIFAIFDYNLLSIPGGENKLNLFNESMKLVCIFFVSYLSYRYVENFFRNKSNLNKKLLFILFFIFSSFLISIGFTGHKTDGFLNIKINDSKQYYINHNIEKNKVLSTNWGNLKSENSDILIIGDSVSSDLQMSLKTIGIKTERFDIDGNCFEKIIIDSKCKNLTIKKFEKVLLNKKYIIIATNILTDKTYKEIQKMYFYLEKKYKVFVLSDLQFAKPTNISFYAINNNQNLNHLSYLYMHEDTIAHEEILKSILPSENIILKRKFFCNDDVKECELLDENNNVIFHDPVHLTTHGWNYFGKKLVAWANQNLN